MHQLLSLDQVNSFKRDGVVVIPSTLSATEIDQTRLGFHDFLRRSSAKCDVEDLRGTAVGLQTLSSTGGSGGVLDVFYEDWKLFVNQHPRVVQAIQDLWASTWGGNEDMYKHPYEDFNPYHGYMYIDRVCFRLPTAVINEIAESTAGQSKKKSKLLQRSLTPHLDCCPHSMFSSSSRKWRPIQAFVALTDNLEPDTGGFEACVGFHREFEAWSKSRKPSSKLIQSKSTNGRGKSDSESTVVSIPPPCVGDFTPIRPLEDKEVIDRFVSIPYKAGDLICWDYRIPHANSRFNLASIAREAIYIGLLPAIPLNKAYAEDQLQRYLAGIHPVDQWISPTEKAADSESPVCSFKFSELGCQLMGMQEWDADGS